MKGFRSIFILIPANSTNFRVSNFRSLTTSILSSFIAFTRDRRDRGARNKPTSQITLNTSRKRRTTNKRKRRFPRQSTKNTTPRAAPYTRSRKERGRERGPPPPDGGAVFVPKGVSVPCHDSNVGPMSRFHVAHWVGMGGQDPVTTAMTHAK